jgi:serine/threonine protein phosphatase PrpC
MNSRNNYSLPKIQVIKNPLQISLEKDTKVFKNIRSNSQRSILNIPTNTNIKIIYKLNERKFTQNKLNSDLSLEEILNENFMNYQNAKHSENSFDKIISYGVNTYKGVIRNYNEDRVTILINALINKDEDNLKKKFHNLNISYFSIYDGHAGNKCCEFLKKFLHHYIFESDFFPLNPIKALEDGFNVCENKFMSLIHSDNQFFDPSGSCAIVILIINDMCYIANLGDSRALYSCNDGKKFLQLSRDHKPNDPLEKNRIYKAGGSISKTLNNSPHFNNNNEKEGLDRTAKIPFRINPGRLAVSYF